MSPKASTLPANVLPTVMGVCVLVLLMVLVMISLWESDMLLFTRTAYLRSQRDNIESAFTLYSNYPDVIDRLDADSTLLLFDSIPASRVKISRKPWGLYEVVTIEASSRQRSVRIMGGRTAYDGDCNFIYRNHSGALTVSGNTNIKGKAAMPQGGVIYGQMQSVFFNGEEIPPNLIGTSPDALLKSFDRDSIRYSYAGKLTTDSLHNPFYNRDPICIDIGSGMLTGCILTGNIILKADRLRLDASCRTEEIIIQARSVQIGEGFKGSAQIFVSDTIIVERGVCLQYPSGLYINGEATKCYIEICEDCRIDGYAIVETHGESDIMKPNFRQSRTARLRGLLYVDGIAQLQGIVTGTAMVGEAVFYSPQGYYRHMLYEVSVLENNVTAYPLFLDPAQRRKEAKWIK